MCLAPIPNWTSLVPPSIELALVRSHSRGSLPPRDRSLSHSSESDPPAAIASSWRRLRRSYGLDFEQSVSRARNFVNRW